MLPFKYNETVATILKAKERVSSSISALSASFDLLAYTAHSAKVKADEAFDSSYPSLVLSSSGSSSTAIPTIKLEPHRDRLLLFLDTIRKRKGASHASMLVASLDQAMENESSSAITAMAGSPSNGGGKQHHQNNDSKGKGGGNSSSSSSSSTNFEAARPYMERRLRWLAAQRAAASEDLTREVSTLTTQALSMLTSAQRNLPKEKAGCVDPAITTWGMVSSITSNLVVCNPRLGSSIDLIRQPRCRVSLVGGKNGEHAPIVRSEMLVQLVEGGK